MFAVIEALRNSASQGQVPKFGTCSYEAQCKVYEVDRKQLSEVEGQGLSVEHSRSSRQGQGKPMTRKKNEKGQSLLEYAMVAAVVAAAVIAMSTYVFRSVQATQQTIQTEFQKE